MSARRTAAAAGGCSGLPVCPPMTGVLPRSWLISGRPERCVGVAMRVRRTPERDRKYLESNDNCRKPDDIPPVADCNHGGAVTLTLRHGTVVSRYCHTLRFLKFPQV